MSKYERAYWTLRKTTVDHEGLPPGGKALYWFERGAKWAEAEKDTEIANLREKIKQFGDRLRAPTDEFTQGHRGPDSEIYWSVVGMVSEVFDTEFQEEVTE